MPVFDYKCLDCGKRYDVYHKVKEVQEDVICPSCGSKSHERLVSVPASPVIGGVVGTVSAAGSSCDGGSCCGGSCNMN